MKKFYVGKTVMRILAMVLGVSVLMTSSSMVVLADGLNEGTAVKEETVDVFEENQEEPEATATPEPIETEEPTATPEPIETEEPTATPEPVETEEPTAMPEPVETEEPTATPEPVETEEPTATPEPVKNGNKLLLTSGAPETIQEEGEKIYKPYEEATYELIYVENGEGVKIIGYTGTAEGRLVLPEMIDGKVVNCIGENAFENCNKFTGDLVIPEGVTSIEDSAFLGCSGFNGSLDLPSSLINIGMNAFQSCKKLTGDLIIPEGVTNIKDAAFYGCSGFNGNLVLPNTTTRIGNSTFCDCSGLKGNLTIPEGVTTIGSCAFSGCSGFTGDLVIPDSVTWLDNTVFRYCSGFNGELKISKKITKIYSYTFYGCSGLSGSLVIPEGVTSIGDYAFCNCSGLTGDLTISEKVESIGSSAFYGCSGLNGSLVIPEGVTNIGAYAFYNCSGLTGDLIIPEKVKSIGSCTFYGCSRLNGYLVIPEGVTSIGDYAFYNCSGLIGDLVIPDSVTSIKNVAFYNCSGFNGNLVLSNNLTSIGSSAFTRCTRLAGELVLPKSLKDIGAGAFYECKGLTGDLIIPEGVTSIGSTTFYNCFGLKGNLVLPNGITSIGQAAFQECGFTGDLVLPDSVRSIERAAFHKCNGFTGDLVIPNGVTSIGEDAFLNCKGFTGNLVISDSVTSIGDLAFGGCTGLKGELTISKGLTSIGYAVFTGNSGLTGELIIPEGVTSIGDFAFMSCSSFTGELLIPDSVTSIGKQAFCGCTGLTGDLIIPNSVTSIGEHAFMECTGFNGSLVLSNGLTSIEEGTFSRCYSLTGSIDIPNSVTSIGRLAFENCGGFTGDLKIPDSVQSIGLSAFYECRGLNGKIWLPQSVEQIATPSGGYLEYDPFSLGNTRPIIIYGTEGSYAETYAKEKGYAFVAPGSGGPGKYPLPDDFETTQQVPNDEYWITLFDDKGNPVEGATITVTPEEAGDAYNYHYEEGVLKIEIESRNSNEVTVTASKEGMLTATEKYNLVKGGSSFLKIRKYSMDPAITSVMISSIKGSNANVLRFSYVIYKSDADNGGKMLDLYVGTAGEKPATYRLEQDGKVLYESVSPNMSVNLARELKLLGGLPEIVTLDANGIELARRKVLFEVLGKNPLDDENSPLKKVSIGQKLSFEVGDVGLPFFSNSEFTIDSQIKVPVTVKMEANKVRVELGNYGILKKSTKGDNPAKLFKEIMTKLNGQNYNEWKNAVTGKNLAGLEMKVELCGYGEGVRDPYAEVTKVDMVVILKCTISHGVTWYYFLGPVPCYFKIDGKINNATTADFYFDIVNGEAKTLNVDIDNELKVNLNAGAGAGVIDVACVEGTLGGNITWKHKAITTELDTNTPKDTVTAQANATLKVKMLFLEWKKTWPSKTVQLYTSSKNKLRSAGMFNSGMPDASEFTPAGRDYILDNGMKKRNLLRSLGTGEDAKVLINGVYPDAKPMLVSWKGSTYLFTLEDIQTRGDEDRTALVYRKENAGVFGEPVILEDDGTADFAYDVLATEEGIHVIWQDAKESMAGITTLDEAAKKLGLSYAKVTENGITLLESPDVTEDLTPISPVLVENGNKVMACWYENTENDLLQSGNGINVFRACEAGSSVAVQKLGETTQAITTSDFGMYEGALCAAVTVDGDKDRSTLTDREIYIISGGVSRKLTNNEVLDSNAQFGKLLGKQVIVYYSGGNLAVTDGETTETVLDAETEIVKGGFVSDDFLFAEETLLWKDSYSLGEEAGQGMTMSRYADGAWSSPVNVVRSSDALVSYSMIQKNEEEVRIVYTASGEQDGRAITRLYETIGKNRATAVITDMDYDEDAYVPGEALDMGITLLNTSDRATESYKIEIADSEGTILFAQAGEGSIPAGAEKEIRINFEPLTPPQDLTEYQLYVSVDGRRNASTTFSLGGASLKLNTDISYDDDEQMLSLQVANEANYPADMKLTIHSEDGSQILYEKEYKEVKGQHSVNYLCNMTGIWEETEEDILRISVESLGRQESYLFDNTGLVMRPGAKNKTTYVDIINEDEELEIGGTLQLSVQKEGNGEVMYESNNPGYVSVSESGLVTAHKKGTATISAYTEDGGRDICVVSVKPEATPEPTVPPTSEPPAEPTSTPKPTEEPVETQKPTEAPAATQKPTEAPAVTQKPTEAPAATQRPTEAPVETQKPTEAPAVTPESDLAGIPTQTPEGQVVTPADKPAEENVPEETTQQPSEEQTPLPEKEEATNESEKPAEPARTPAEEPETQEVVAEPKEESSPMIGFVVTALALTAGGFGGIFFFRRRRIR